MHVKEKCKVEIINKIYKILYHWIIIFYLLWSAWTYAGTVHVVGGGIGDIFY